MSTTLRLPSSPKGVLAVGHVRAGGGAWCVIQDGVAVGIDAGPRDLTWLFAEADTHGARLAAILHTDLGERPAGRSFSDLIASGNTPFISMPATLLQKVPRVSAVAGWSLENGGALISVDGQIFEVVPGETGIVRWSPDKRPPVLHCGSLFLDLGPMIIEVLPTPDKPERLAYRVRDSLFVGSTLQASRALVAGLSDRPACIYPASRPSGVAPVLRRNTDVPEVANADNRTLTPTI